MQCINVCYILNAIISVYERFNGKNRTMAQLYIKGLSSDQINETVLGQTKALSGNARLHLPILVILQMVSMGTAHAN